MKTKTEDLTGAALDWAVEAAQEVQFKEGRVIRIRRADATTPAWIDKENCPGSFPYFHRVSTSTNWSQGGPIIEWEGICIISCWADGKRITNPYDSWRAYIPFSPQGELVIGETTMYGPTPLIAAMRCYVLSRLGDEVEIPDELGGGE